MASERLLDHFRHPRNVGELSPPAITVEAVNPACGDILRLSADFAADRVIAVAYKARGCPASIAAGSALTEIMLNKTIPELRLLRNEAIEAAVDGLEPASKHAAQLCIDGLNQLLTKRG
jgi:nitrogen fixation NifU-like protein